MRVTCRVTAEMYDRFLAAARAAYGRQGKSRWVREALAMLKEGDPVLSSVGLGEVNFQPEAHLQVSLDAVSAELLETLVARVRWQDPLAQGVASQILRAAIRWRLARSPGPIPPAKA